MCKAAAAAVAQARLESLHQAQEVEMVEMELLLQ